MSNSICKFLLLAAILLAFPGCSRNKPPEKTPEPENSGYFFQYRGNLQRTGVFNARGPSSPELLWRFNCKAPPGHSMALLPDGVVVAGTRGDSLFFIHGDGRLKNKVGLDSWVFSSPAAGPGGLVYVGCDSGAVYCFEPSGGEKWKLTLNAETSSSPAVTANAIYIGAEDNALHCISPEGKLNWSFPVQQRILFSSPALDSEGFIYVGAEDSRLYKVSPDGKKVWDFNCGAEISTTSPVLLDDGSVVMAAAENLFCISKEGREIWHIKLNEEMIGTPAVFPGNSSIAACTLDGVFHIISLEGKIKTKKKLAGKILSGPVADSDSRIYVMAEKGLFVLNKDGKVLSKVSNPEWGPFEGDPVVGPGNRIYAGGNDGYIYCFGER